jgi:phosphatidylinositol alpha-1,6-mannosyltransferase
LYRWGYLRFVPLAFCFVYALFAWRPKIVLAMNIAYGGILAFALRFMGYRYYLWAYGYEFHKVQGNPVLRRLYLKIYENAQCVFVITEFVANRLREFGVAPDKMRMVYPAVDPQRFRPLDIPRQDGQRVLLSVTRLVERKGLDQVIRALPQVLATCPGVQYWITGEGPMRTRWEELVQSMGLQDRVRFLGRVPEDELVELYNRCDVFLMPSRECQDSGHVEGFGIVFLEANACGKPVIGGTSGGMPEAIEEGKTGLLVDPEYIHGLAKAILRLLNDAPLARQMGQYGRRRVLEKFNWNRTMQEMRLN